MPLYSQKRRGMKGELCIVFPQQHPWRYRSIVWYTRHDLAAEFMESIWKFPTNSQSFQDAMIKSTQSYTIINCVYKWLYMIYVICIEIRIHTLWKRVHLILGCLLWEGDLDPANVGSSALSLCSNFRQKLCGSDTVDGRNLANKLTWRIYRYLPVEVGSFSHYLQGFIHSMWCCRIFSINSM